MPTTCLVNCILRPARHPPPTLVLSPGDISHAHRTLLLSLPLKSTSFVSHGKAFKHHWDRLCCHLLLANLWPCVIKSAKSTYFGESKWFLGKCSLIEGKRSPFGEKLLFFGANLSLLWVHYHLNLAFVYFIKSTRKSWHGSDPPLLSGNARISEAPHIATPP